MADTSADTSACRDELGSTITEQGTTLQKCLSSESNKINCKTPDTPQCANYVDCVAKVRCEAANEVSQECAKEQQKVMSDAFGSNCNVSCEKSISVVAVVLIVCVVLVGAVAATFMACRYVSSHSLYCMSHSSVPCLVSCRKSKAAKAKADRTNEDAEAANAT
jgi:hypothetical protein